MKITLNSTETVIPDHSTVDNLKNHIGISGMSCAVAVNGKIVAASSHENHILKDGDDIIIIGAAYGG
ncbi:MAG: sulfur carrier protein ThiS [Muribaculaceae bacterium]|nr:sulfur carrier protein ThiS [Muribaculaceae bacterium]